APRVPEPAGLADSPRGLLLFPPNLPLPARVSWVVYPLFFPTRMAQLKIQREWLEQAKQRGNLTDAEKSQVERLLGDGPPKSTVAANVHDLPAAFLKALLDDSRLTPNQRAVVSMQIHGMTGTKEDPN